MFWLVVCGLGLWTAPGVAQEAIYRCGDEYTNAPRVGALCERLATQAVTVIGGTRPVSASQRQNPAAQAQRPVAHSAPTALAAPPAAESVHSPRLLQSERDAQARLILGQELAKAREQLAQLQQTYQQGEPEKWASESKNHQSYLDRVASLKAQIERTERDIDSLQRELSRRSVPDKLAQTP